MTALGAPPADAAPGPRLRALAGAAATADGLLRQRRPGLSRRLSRREWRVESATAAIFAVAAVALPLAWPRPWPDPLTALLLVTTYCLVARVRFQVGPGLIRPTELVLVPMLFLLPTPAVPALVAAGSVLSVLPEILRRRAHPERIVVAIADSMYAVGPALVVTLLAPADPTQAAAGVYVLALLAQFGVDFATSTAREYLGTGLSPRELAPVLGIVYLADALLAPIGFLAVLATQEHPQAYLLAAAPGALLALIARERGERIEQELRLGRAYRRFTGLLDAQANDLRRQAGDLKRRPVAAVAAVLERGVLGQVLLAATVEAMDADCGRLTLPADDGAPATPLAVGTHTQSQALRAAEAALLAGPALRQVTVGGLTALAVPLAGHRPGDPEPAWLTVGRVGAGFSRAERELLEHLAAQAAVSLENLRLHELMRKTEEELLAILEGVADAVTVEEPGGRLVYANPEAVRLLGCAAADDLLDDVAERLRMTDEAGAPVAVARLPGRRALAGEPPRPLVVRYRRADTGEPGASRVKATPVLDERGRARLAISVIEDVTEIMQAEEAQRLLAESSRLLAESADVEATLGDVARLAVERLADWCTIHLRGERGLRAAAIAHADPAGQAIAETLAREYPPGADDPHGAGAVLRTGEPELIPEGCAAVLARDEHERQLLASLGVESAMTVPLRARDRVLGAIALMSAGSGRRFGPQELALAEDLGLRAGTAVDHARLYRTRSAIAQTLQASLLPPALPEIPGLETAALFQAAGEGHQVGGDFYDVFPIGKHQWFAVMGDVCGKGAEAAAITALARYTIRAAVVRRRSPAGILHWLNDAMLRQSADRTRFATIACVRLDLESEGVTATVASGGHPCPRVLRTTGLVEELGVPGTLLGAVPTVQLADRATRLVRGDALILYTDGLTEAGAPARVWSPTQLDLAIAETRHGAAQEIVEGLARAALGEAAAPLRDDIALLALRVT
jgi:PAS domain S-box-containing protein